MLPSLMHWVFKATLSKCGCSATRLGILRMYDNAHWTYESETRVCRTFYAVVHIVYTLLVLQWYVIIVTSLACMHTPALSAVHVNK